MTKLIQSIPDVDPNRIERVVLVLEVEEVREMIDETLKLVSGEGVPLSGESEEKEREWKG